MTASNKKLGDLHDFYADSVRKAMQAHLDAGEPIPPSLLKECREFLKDNDITSTMDPGTPAGDLKAGMPTFEDAEESYAPQH